MLDKGRLRTFVLGGAAGLLAGLLLAPRSGRETRGSLANRAGEARERGRESYFEAREQMRERVSDGRRPPPGAAERDFSPADAPAAAQRPRLRDVSSGVEAAGAAEEADREMERSEELRRKVRETQERLRGRRDVGKDPEA